MIDYVKARGPLDHLVINCHGETQAPVFGSEARVLVRLGQGFDTYVAKSSLWSQLAGKVRYIWFQSCSVGLDTDQCGKEVFRFQVLGNLTQLRVLDLEGQEVRKLDFVRTLRALRRLDLRYTKVDDLSAIGGLKQLEDVRADMTPVERLPTGPLPALRRLTLLSTKVSDQDVAAFARAHPKCTVHRDWVGMLRHQVAGATRLRMYDGSSERHHDFFPQTLELDIDAAEHIARFVALIEIDESASSCEPMAGAATFKFYRGSERAATPIIHDGKCLQWHGHWPGPAQLTEQSAAALRTSLARRGIVEVDGLYLPWWAAPIGAGSRGTTTR